MALRFPTTIIILGLLSVFGLLLNFLGVPMPKEPAISLLIIMGVQALLLSGAPLLVNLAMSSSDWETKYLTTTKVMLAIVVLSNFSVIAKLCSHDGEWTGAKTGAEAGLIGGSCFCHMIGLAVVGISRHDGDRMAKAREAAGLPPAFTAVPLEDIENQGGDSVLNKADD